MAEEKTKSGKGKDGKAAPRRKAAPAAKKAEAPGKPPAEPKPATASKKPAGRTAARDKRPSPAKTGTTAAKSTRKSAKKSPAPARAIPEAASAPAGGAVPWQRQAGYALIAASAAGIAGIGVWFGPDPMQSTLHWAGRAAVQGVCAALIAGFLWVVLSRRRAVPYVLVLGCCATALLAYDLTAAWRVDRIGIAANRALAALEARQRAVGSLTPEEAANPYVDAYLAMRDVHWELTARSDKGMSRYRSRYADYTAGGSFLDTARLTTANALRRSLRQIQNLEKQLLRVETSPPELSDLLLTVELLKIDDGTRSAYAADLRTARDGLVAAAAAFTARERRTLAATRRSLKVLLEAKGRYRIESGRIVFDDPADAARFAGKDGGG